MTRLTVEEYAAALRPRYRTARRGDKKKILDEFCETTGTHRKAAIRLLHLTTGPRARRRAGHGATGRTCSASSSQWGAVDEPASVSIKLDTV